MPKINLATEVFRARLIARRRRVLYGLSVLLLLVLIGLWGLPVLLQKNVEKQIATVDQEIRSIDAHLKRQSADVRVVKLFTERLELLKNRLGNRLGWSRVLAELERLTIPTANFRRLSGTAATGEITADVQVLSLDAAADLLVSFQQTPGANETFFSAVEVAGLTTRESATGAPEQILSLRMRAGPASFHIPGPATRGTP